MTREQLHISAWYDNNPIVQALKRAAYERGVAVGRRQAASELAAKFRGIVLRCDHDPKLQRAYEMAALVVEEHVSIDPGACDAVVPGSGLFRCGQARDGAHRCIATADGHEDHHCICGCRFSMRTPPIAEESTHAD